MIGLRRPQYPGGRLGNSGMGQGWGRFSEPRYMPEWDIFDSPPTASEIASVRDHFKDNLLLATDESPWETATYNGVDCYGLVAFEVDTQPNPTYYHFEANLIYQDIPIAESLGELYRHYSLILMPQTYGTGTPPATADRPIYVNTHGGVSVWDKGRTARWLSKFTDADIRDNAIFVFPVLFDFPFQFHRSPSEYQASEAFKAAHYSPSMPIFPDIDVPPMYPGGWQDNQFKQHLTAFGLRVEDLSIRAVSHCLDVLRNYLELPAYSWFNTGNSAYTTSSDVLFLGESYGGAIAPAASLLFTNSAAEPYLETVGLIDVFGGSDRFARFNQSEMQRYTAAYLTEALGSTYGWVIPQSAPPITMNMRDRARTLYEAYNVIGDTDTEGFRKLYLLFSPAQFWDYAMEYAMQLYHGAQDNTVLVASSRHWRQVMLAKGVSTTDFQYYETLSAGHFGGQVTANYQDELFDFIKNKLNIT